MISTYVKLFESKNVDAACNTQNQQTSIEWLSGNQGLGKQAKMRFDGDIPSQLSAHTTDASAVLIRLRTCLREGFRRCTKCGEDH